MCNPARPLVEFSVFESFGGTLMDSDVPVGIFGVFVMLSMHVHVSDLFGFQASLRVILCF